MFKVTVQMIQNDGDDASTTIGGFDHNFPRVTRYDEVLNRFASNIVQRWPNAIFYVSDDVSDIHSTVHATDLPLSLPRKGFILVVRDGAMDRHEQLEGSIPMSDGESSLALWFFPVNAETHYLDLVTVNDPLENEFCWWAVEQIWDAYLTSKKIGNPAP